MHFLESKFTFERQLLSYERLMPTVDIECVATFVAPCENSDLKKPNVCEDDFHTKYQRPLGQNEALRARIDVLLD